VAHVTPYALVAFVYKPLRPLNISPNCPNLNMSGRPALANKNTYHRTSSAAGNASAKKAAKKPGKRAKQAQDVSNAVEQKRAYESESLPGCRLRVN
jgi:hypothetical protein